MLNSITTWKRYLKDSLNVFLIEKNFDDDKKIINMIDFLSQIEILLLKTC